MHLTEQASKDNEAIVGSENDSAGAPAELRKIELLNDRLRQCCELVQRCNDFPTWEVTGFAEAYLRGELNLGLLCSAFGDEANYGFIYSCADPSSGYGNKGVNRPPPPRHYERSRANLGGQESLMLPHNIEIVQSAEQTIAVLSSVRFQRFDDSSFLGGEGLYEFVPFVSLTGQEDDLGGSNGKVCLINKRLAVAIRQSASHDVKAASNCVKVDASFDLESNRERLFFRDHHHIIGNIRWLLSESQVNIIAEPSIEPFLKGWEIGFGPIDRGLRVE